MHLKKMCIYKKYINLNLNDDPNQDLSQVLIPVSNVIIDHMKRNNNVFVHCAAGISRSSSIVIYTLMKFHKWDFDRTLSYVKGLHTRTNPNYGFVTQLMNTQENIKGLEINRTSKNENYQNFELIEPPIMTQRTPILNNREYEKEPPYSQNAHNNSRSKPLPVKQEISKGQNINRVQTSVSPPYDQRRPQQEPMNTQENDPYRFESGNMYSYISPEGRDYVSRDPTKPWNSLTFDSDERDRPAYSQYGRGKYARIFS